MTKAALRIATRKSELAQWQANEVGRTLGEPYELLPVETHGDIDVSSPLSEIGGQGVFVKEVQMALLRKEADIAVHSAKDLPAATHQDLIIAAFLPRGDVRDAMVGSPLMALANGATVATGSARRKAILLWHRPDLNVVALRGNIRTRLARVGEADAVVIAYAALLRLGLATMAAEVLDPEVFCPQVAQGAIAIETRADDSRAIEAASHLDDALTRAHVSAERSMLKTLGSGCTLPVGAYSTSLESGNGLFGMIASLDGKEVVSASMSGSDALRLGAEMGAYLLSAGGERLLASATSRS